MCSTCCPARAPRPSSSASSRASSTAVNWRPCPPRSVSTTLEHRSACRLSKNICARHRSHRRGRKPMSSPITVDPDRAPREQSYLQHGSSFVDRLRTRLVEREILKRLPQTSGLRVLDLGCGYHATSLKAIGKRLAEGVGVDLHVSEESRRHPRLSFVASSVEDALPKLPSNAFDAVLFISVLEHIRNPAECLSHASMVCSKPSAW